MRSHSSYESITEHSLMNGTRSTFIQIPHNIQKINEEDSQEVDGKKRNQNSLEQIIYLKNLKRTTSFKVVPKYMHSSSNVNDIRKQIESYGHLLPIYGISKSKALERLPMFYIELKIKNHNKNV